MGWDGSDDYHSFLDVANDVIKEYSLTEYTIGYSGVWFMSTESEPRICFALIKELQPNDWAYKLLDEESGIEELDCPAEYLEKTKVFDKHWRKYVRYDQYPDITLITVDLYMKSMPKHSQHWQHPNADSYFSPDSDGYDSSLYRIWLENDKGDLANISFKSEQLDFDSDVYYEIFGFDLSNKNREFEFPFLRARETMDVISSMLFSKWYRLRDKHDSNNYTLFYKTPVSKVIRRHFKIYKLSGFSPDCALWRDDDGMYGYDT